MPGYSLSTDLRIVSLCAPAAERDPTHDKVSSTAAVIAASTVFLSREKFAGQLVSRCAAELSELFLRHLPQPARFLLRTLSAGAFRPLGRLIEHATVPGIQLHYALRKLHLEQAARRFIREGGDQCVVLGGGFDTLAIRLADEYPHVRFVEVDRPATQEIKTAALARSAHRGNPLFLPLELPNEGFAQALASCSGRRTAERSLFVAEGLLMYLARTAVESLFGTVCRLAPPGSLFAFTFMEKDADGRVTFREQGKVVDLWLRLRGEQFAWGIARKEIAAFVATFSFRVREVLTSADLRALYLPDGSHLPVAEGECVCVAERI